MQFKVTRICCMKMILKLMNNNKMKKVKNVCTWTNIYGLDVRKSMLAF